MKKALTIYLVSDSTGETAEWITRAAVKQFQNGDVKLRRVPYLNSEGAIRRAVEKMDARPALIVYTLIVPRLSKVLAAVADDAGIPAVDIIGPVMNKLSRLLSIEPKLQPGLLHELDEAYYQRIDAIEFAIRYDDGKDAGRGIEKADVVLIGVSRTSKTPVSMYLALKGFRVANLPLVPEVEPAEELFEAGEAVVIGLTITPERLQAIRRQRIKNIGLSDGAPYGDPQRIRAELRYAEEIFERIGCPVIDVSGVAIEETAGEVVRFLRKGTGKKGEASEEEQ